MLAGPSKVIYIQILEPDRATAFLLLLKGGFSVVCLPGEIYGVGEEHLRFLKRKRVVFKKLNASKIRLPEPRLAG
jgi:hypothetical protein